MWSVPNYRIRHFALSKHRVGVGTDRHRVTVRHLPAHTLVGLCDRSRPHTPSCDPNATADRAIRRLSEPIQLFHVAAEFCRAVPEKIAPDYYSGPGNDSTGRHYYFEPGQSQRLPAARQTVGKREMKQTNEASIRLRRSNFGELRPYCGQHAQPSVAVLDRGHGDHHCQQQPAGVGGDMPFAPVDVRVSDKPR